jgi:cysteine-rich repeat protein
VQCGDSLCPAGTVCSPTNQCVLQTQLDACNGATTGARCSFPGVAVGVCNGPVCVVAGCGNEVVEPGEMCDDGNKVSLDGCSADCTSDEMCGNGVIDAVRGEQCDCGVAGAVRPGCAGPNSDTGLSECRTTCERPRCGDGVLDPGELCDDGNNAPYDGCRADCQGRWTAMVIPTFNDLLDVWADSDANIWVSGESKILHWDGTQWTDIAPPPAFHFRRIYGPAADDAYVISDQPQALYHYNGSGWTVPAALNGIGWRDIYARAPNDIWLVGAANTAPHERTAHFDGQWTVLTPTIDQVMTSVWVAPTGEMFGGTQTDAICQRTTTPSTVWLSTAGAGNVVTGTSATDVTTTSPSTGAYHYNGALWSTQSGSEEVDANDIAAAPGEQILVAGSGNVMSCDGTKCQGVPTPTTRDLGGVCTYVTAQQERRWIIVGNNGTVLR